MKHRTRPSTLPLLLVFSLAAAMGGAYGCRGAQGLSGRDGVSGEDGQDGVNGQDGTDGQNGQDGVNGQDGQDGQDGLQGPPGLDGAVGPKGDPGDPAPTQTDATNLAEFVKERVLLYATDTLPEGEQFPLSAAATDSLRTIEGMHANVVISWLEPLTFNEGATAPRFGANPDYIAYFGDGWNAVAGSPPQWNGDSAAGWMWVNHEYISGFMPNLTSAPTGQHLQFARYLHDNGILLNNVGSSTWAQEDIDTYILNYKKQLGGSWMRVVQDPSTGEWAVDRSAAAKRYDATSSTLLRLSWQAMSGPDHDETGAQLPAGVMSGIFADCAGGLSPWGTVFTAEENVQDYYGDLESCWSTDQKFLVGQGFDAGANISPTFTASATSDFGRSSNPNQLHARDLYGYLAEMDVGQPANEYDGKTTPGVGHKKIGGMGRSRWETAAFAVDSDWKLVPNQPIVVYGQDDRRSGRIYKYVTSANYTAGMTKAQTRALLDDGRLYAAHFAGLDNTTGDTMLATGGPPVETAPGAGVWIELSVDSTDIAPNAAALGVPAKTVGAALQDVNWNNIGGFPTDDDVRRALFTASAKIGVMELNRPEDMEWNPRDISGTPRLYVTFTKNEKRTQLDQNGVLRDPATHASSVSRADLVGSIFAIQEANPMNPGASSTFSFFQVWHGMSGNGIFNAANPDNLLIDHDGGVWFGTDGNFATNARADALYYLDLDPAHQGGQPGIVTPSYGLAFRVVATPSDAEATGPALTTDMGTLFLSVQHPGEMVYSTWPYGDRLSAVVALTFSF